MGNLDNIDIFHSPFADVDFNPNAEGGEYKNEKLTIVFRGGMFGHQLRYFIDKFSLLTPAIKKNIFTDIGTAHVKKFPFSPIINLASTFFIKNNAEKKNLPICLLVASEPIGYLYLLQSQLYRIEDRKIDVDAWWKKTIKELEANEEKEIGIGSLEKQKYLYSHSKEIIDLYKLKNLEKIPKFIIRDWYKKDFLRPINETYNYKTFQTLKNHKFLDNQNVHLFPFEAFFSYDVFKSNLKKVSDRFDLKIDWTQEAELKKDFETGLSRDKLRLQIIEVQKILDAIKNKNNYNITMLNVMNEAYIYAELEKAHNNTIMPLTNTFYKNTNEILEFLNCFPNEYSLPNPNLLA